jgi:hypothetical protein
MLPTGSAATLTEGGSLVFVLGLEATKKIEMEVVQ